MAPFNNLLVAIFVLCVYYFSSKITYSPKNIGKHVDAFRLTKIWIIVVDVIFLIVIELYILFCLYMYNKIIFLENMHLDLLYSDFVFIVFLITYIDCSSNVL